MATGGLDGTQKSNQFCFVVQPGAPVAEVPWPWLFGLSGVAVAGAYVLFERRRRRPTVPSS
jgi:hypothetical protein